MATIASRLREAMAIREMKQADLVSTTGIGKSSISTYLSGEYEPKQKNIYKLAAALDVSEAWLMGEDVPMDRITPDEYAEIVKKHVDREQAFLDAHFGVVYGDPQRLQLGASLLTQSPEDRDNAAVILRILTELCRDSRADKIEGLKELTEMFRRLPSAKCEAIMDFAKYIAKSQDDN